MFFCRISTFPIYLATNERLFKNLTSQRQRQAVSHLIWTKSTSLNYVPQNEANSAEIKTIDVGNGLSVAVCPPLRSQL